MGSAPGGQQAGPARGAVRDRRRELGAFLLMADDPTIRIVILYPAAAPDAAKLERLAG
jgi:hypothetical protein